MRAIWPDCEPAGGRGGPCDEPGDAPGDAPRGAPCGAPDGARFGARDDRRRFGVLMSREPAGGRMPEDRLCRMLAAAGSGMGARVIVFAPEGVRKERGAGLVRGWTLEEGGWTPLLAPVPPVFFDRRFPRTPAEQAAGARAVRILLRHGAAPLGRALPGKAQVHAALRRCAPLRPLLPPTAVFTPRRLADLLAAHPAGLFLKPAAGMQGRGTAALRPEPGGGIVRITGRTMRNRPFELRVPAERLAEAAASLARGRPYLVQPLLCLKTAADEPFDLRLFVQKDGAGRWALTGAAVRIGRPGAAASNLHGGGTARPALPFLAAMLGDRAAARLFGRAKRAALLAAREAERAFGRLAEIGADFGIEPGGRLWLLELNAKPGRAIFAEIGDDAGERLAAERTISYGLRLMKAGAPARGARGPGRPADRHRKRCMNGTTAHSTATMQEVQS